MQSVQELIPDSFVPCVAALCSDDAERLARLNQLSFAELLKPFTRLTSEGTWASSGPGDRPGGGGRVDIPAGGGAAGEPVGSAPSRPQFLRALPFRPAPAACSVVSATKTGAAAQGGGRCQGRGRSGAQPHRRPGAVGRRGQRGASLSPCLVILLFFSPLKVHTFSCMSVLYFTSQEHTKVSWK